MFGEERLGLWSRPGVATTLSIDTQARDVRMNRAAEQVLRQYTIRKLNTESPNQACYRVSAGVEHDYQVTLYTDWSSAPHCTCPDALREASKAAPGTWCKHVLAVLMKYPQFRGQLLDMFL